MRAEKFGSLALVCWLRVLLLLASLDLAQGCGPGRAGIRRVMLRKYPPLVQRQYIPNVSENTLGASGKPEGPIRRKDKRFRELVQNRNPDIEFKDQERTGADRMMSQRLKEKLSTLAISVMNQWPNVKLRVIEGWDEDNKHAVNSLHYEGRAVDITTSDRDKAKYGMLARLAVEAGFDWVHYEAKSHVHCSVKSERADSIRNNGCFEAGALVHTPAGPMQMAQLQTSDQVLAMDPRTGRLHYSPVILWLDRDESGRELYVELKTKSNKLLRLTSSHLIYIADQPTEGGQSTSSDSSRDDKAQYYFYDYANHTDASGNATSPTNDGFGDERLALEDVAYTTYARNALVGQYLLVDASVGREKSPTMAASQRQQLHNHRRHSNELEMEEESASVKLHKPSRLVFSGDKSVNGNVQEPAGVTFDQIVSVNYVTRRGIYAPLTREGNIVVNSVVASCYAVISEHELAHMSFAPIRWLSYLSELLFGLKPATSPNERTLAAMSNRRFDKQPQQQQLDLPHAKGRSRNSSGSREIHWYPATLYRIARLILPTKYLY